VSVTVTVTVTVIIALLLKLKASAQRLMELKEIMSHVVLALKALA